MGPAGPSPRAIQVFKAHGEKIPETRRQRQRSRVSTIGRKAPYSRRPLDPGSECCPYDLRLANRASLSARSLGPKSISSPHHSRFTASSRVVRATALKNRRHCRPQGGKYNWRIRRDKRRILSPSLQSQKCGRPPEAAFLPLPNTSEEGGGRVPPNPADRPPVVLQSAASNARPTAGYKSNFPHSRTPCIQPRLFLKYDLKPNRPAARSGKSGRERARSGREPQ